jgi:hypothetical protein
MQGQYWGSFEAERPRLLHLSELQVERLNRRDQPDSLFFSYCKSYPLSTSLLSP